MKRVLVTYEFELSQFDSDTEFYELISRIKDETFYGIVLSNSGNGTIQLQQRTPVSVEVKP